MTDSVNIQAYADERMHSEKIDLICAALAGFQAEMEPLRKTGRNFTKGAAATIGDIVSVARHGAKHGLSFYQPSKVMRGFDGKQNDHFLRTIVMHKSGQWISAGWIPVVPNKPNDMAAIGGALTYARKYSLQMAMGIADHNDDDIDWDHVETNDTSAAATGSPGPADTGGPSDMHLPKTDGPSTNNMKLLDDVIPDFDKPPAKQNLLEELQQFTTSDQLRAEMQKRKAEGNLSEDEKAIFIQRNNQLKEAS